jgi:hypothetical protein
VGERIDQVEGCTARTCSKTTTFICRRTVRLHRRRLSSFNLEFFGLASRQTCLCATHSFNVTVEPLKTRDCATLLTSAVVGVGKALAHKMGECKLRHCGVNVGVCVCVCVCVRACARACACACVPRACVPQVYEESVIDKLRRTCTSSAYSLSSPCMNATPS